MSFLTNTLPGLATFTGSESMIADTNLTAGANPSQVEIAIYKLALMMTTMMNQLNKTMVAGTIYYTRFNFGSTTSFDPDSALPATTQSTESVAITGVNVPIGTTGGTDTWHVGVWNSAGILVARSITAGVTAGTASTIQQIPLYATDGSTIGPITLASGTYYVGLQSNGTTATFKSINSPVWPFATGSQTGSAGTLPKITTVATTYTTNLGPAVSLY